MTETVLRADMMLTPTGVVTNAELAFEAEGDGGGAGRITYAGPARAGSAVTHDLAGHLLMPGLANGHTHSAMTLMRGVSDDKALEPWLQEVQALEQFLTHEDVAVGLQLAMLEMIETGTTVFADMYHWDGDLIELVRDAGMRVLAAPSVASPESAPFPSVSPRVGAEVIAETEALAAHYADDPQIRIAYGPHTPYTCPPEFLKEIAERAARLGIPIHTHVSESSGEIEGMLADHGATPGDHLDALGVFEAEVHAAHCVYLTDREIELFARTGASISHNPVSNLKLGNGIARLPELLAAGVRLAIGTDSAASNNSLDLFEEIKLATLLPRGVRQDASVVRGAEVLEVATAGGSAALGFPDAGALEAGRLADVIALDISGTAATPVEAASIESYVVFNATGADVRHVFVGGRHLYADGVHLTLDAESIRDRARVARARLRAASQTAG